MLFSISLFPICKIYLAICNKNICQKDLKATIAAGFHLFPFRTEKLRLPAPMVLHLWESRSSPIFKKGFVFNIQNPFFVYTALSKTIPFFKDLCN